MSEFESVAKRTISASVAALLFWATGAQATPGRGSLAVAAPVHSSVHGLKPSRQEVKALKRSLALPPQTRTRLVQQERRTAQIRRQVAGQLTRLRIAHVGKVRGAEVRVRTQRIERGPRMSAFVWPPQEDRRKVEFSVHRPTVGSVRPELLVRGRAVASRDRSSLRKMWSVSELRLDVVPRASWELPEQK